MPKFQVLMRVDAFADYVAEVEANSADEASELAYSESGRYDWTQRGIATFDACAVFALDDQGAEIESTERSDF